ncbi:MAG: topology modulation protein [Sphingobium sp.]
METRRILILGASGAGKSTLARQLGERLAVPVTHLDSLFWQPGWVGDHPDFTDKANAAAAGESWVIEGGYTNEPSFASRLERADIIVLLDFPGWRCVARIIRRTLHWHGRTRPDMTAGCIERFDREFLLYVWRWRRDIRARTTQRITDTGRTPLILQTPREVASFLARFPPTGQPSLAPA